jgi:hypothetical protein
MRRILIVLAVLGSGTALSFLAAGAIFLADPDGNLVPTNGFGGRLDQGFIQPAPMKPVPMPMPTPGGLGMGEAPGVVVDPVTTDAFVGGVGGAQVDVVEVDLPPQSGTQP